MSKSQVIYNQVGLFVGPAPSSGYHFLDTYGNQRNVSGILGENYNLVFPLNRVNGISYSIEPPIENISQLGSFGAVARPILDNTDVNLNIKYNLMGLVNEARIGMYVNTPSGDLITGEFRYGTGRICPISGFYTRDMDNSHSPDTLNWPLAYRDARNIFVAARKDSLSFNSTHGDAWSGLDYQAYQDIFVYGFGDCYLNSYKFDISVGTPPSVSIDYTCNNIEVYGSGSGLDIPSISPGNQNLRSGIKFNIPDNFQGSNLPTVLLPSDISLDIRQRDSDSIDLDNSIVDFKDIKIQNFSFNFNLNRKALYGVGYKYPTDRVVTFPVECDVSFNCVAGDGKSGSLSNLIRYDRDYDITMQLNYQQGNDIFTGLAVEYEFLGSKFNGLNSDVSISEKKLTQFNFTTELSPHKNNQGLFIRGYLGLTRTPSFDEIFLGASGTPPGDPVKILLTPTSDSILVGYEINRGPRPIF